MKRLASLFSLLFALMLIASACSSSDEESTEDDTEETDTTEDTSDADEDTDDEESSDASAAGATPDDCQDGDVVISGSSTVEPISRNVAVKYEDACEGASITVDGPGTTDGFDLFCQGETDISDASRPIKDEEIAACEESGVEFVELQVALDGMAVLVNPSNDAIECLSFADLYALMGGEADGNGSWADSQDIASELGSEVEYPDAPMDISAPGTESGTYGSFIEIALEDIAEERGSEDAPIREDFSGQADDELIVQGIVDSESSFGWVGIAFANANADDVKAVDISEEPGGECVTAGVDTIEDGSYPLSRGLYIYVSTTRMAENPAIASYVDFYLSGAYEDSVVNAISEGNGYIPLGDELKTETDSAWDAAK